MMKVILHPYPHFRRVLTLITSFFIISSLSAQQPVRISGKVRAVSGDPVQGVHITLKGGTGTTSRKDGRYAISSPLPGEITITFSHIRYRSQQLKFYALTDTLLPDLIMQEESYPIPGIDVSASAPLPDTIVGSEYFSIADFDFLGDTLVLLTYARRPDRDLHVRYHTLDGRELLLTSVPDETSGLFKDYQNRIFVLGKHEVQLIENNDEKLVLRPFDRTLFDERLKPCIDTLNRCIIFSDYSAHFPAFSFYSYHPESDSSIALRFIEDGPLHRLYRYEYYYLKPADKMFAMKLSDQTGIDKHTIAAHMTGFTSGMYFDPLYAPLFVHSDTITIFDHYSDRLVRYDSTFSAIDSTSIRYHREKDSGKWRRKVIMDSGTGTFYTLFLKDNYYFLRRLDTDQGTLTGSFRLYYRYVEKIRIRNGYVYYTYHPFQSLQKKFLYREKIIF